MQYLKITPTIIMRGCTLAASVVLIAQMCGCRAGHIGSRTTEAQVPNTVCSNKKGLFPQAFELNIMGNTPKVVVTISVEGKPICSADGAVWLNREVLLNPGSALPYERTIRVLWEEGVTSAPVVATVRVANPYGVESVYQVESVKYTSE